MIEKVGVRLAELLDKEITDNNAIKFGISLESSFIKQNHTDVPEYLAIARRTDRDLLILNKTEIPDKVNMAMGSLLRAIDEFTNMGSGWVFDSGKKAEVNISHLGEEHTLRHLM